MNTFVCEPCRKDQHDQCNGGSYCDCQHRIKTWTPHRWATSINNYHIVSNTPRIWATYRYGADYLTPCWRGLNQRWTMRYQNSDCYII